MLNEKLRKLIGKERNSKKPAGTGGLLEMLLRSEEERDGKLTDSQITDNIIGVIFAAHDTTASVMTWVLKYLHDNNDVLEAVTVNLLRYWLKNSAPIVIRKKMWIYLNIIVQYLEQPRS